MKGSSKATTPAKYIGELPEPRKSELAAIHKLIVATVPTFKPIMVAGMIGYGLYHYKSVSGREGDWPVVALASQKNYISLYICMSDGKQYLAEKRKKEFPKASIGKSCIRFKRLSDIDLGTVKSLLKETEQETKKQKTQML